MSLQRTAGVGAATLGVIICSQRWQVISAFGLAADPAIQDAAIAACRTLTSRSDHEGTIFPIDVTDTSNRVAQRYIGLRLHDDMQQLVLLRDSSHEAALFDFVGTVPFASAILNHFITNPYQAITVVDKSGNLRFVSPVHERFLGLHRGEGYGSPASDVIPNSRLGEVVKSGRAEIGQLQVMHGVTRVVNRIPIRRDGEVVGAIGQIMFKEPEALTRMQRSLARMRTEMEQYRRELHALREQASPATMLIGGSAPMQRLRREIETVAKLDVPVLILGETGTGKELVARAIHAAGRDAATRPSVSLNLAALPATLLESELFGYAPGTFTGGRREGQAGKLEQAEGGTLFLDEVADIPMEMQVKLLRVLEDHMVERLGSRTARRVDFRIVAATNRDIQSLIDAGRFRLDLYYRLSGVVLRIPALGQRREDIPALLIHFIHAFCERNNISPPAVAPDVARYLAERTWPGNVRQLRQKVEEALVFCDGRLLRVEDFTREDRQIALAESETDPRRQTTGQHHDVARAEAHPSQATLTAMEYQAVQNAIARHGGNKKQAAESLGISRSYLYKVLQRAKPE